jgi:hypothetical protein
VIVGRALVSRSPIPKEHAMGIKDFLKKPQGPMPLKRGWMRWTPMRIFWKGLAAVAGYEGVKVVKEHFDGEQEQDALHPPTIPTSDAQPTDDAQDN